MNLSYFIAKRITQERQSTFSSTIHKIAIATITVGLGAAIVSFLIMMGFQDTIKDKIFGFSSHLQITKFTMNNSIEGQPFFYNIDLFRNRQDYPLVNHVQEFSHKVGLIKTENEVMGVVFKGVGKSFDVERFRENMVDGDFVHFPDSGYSRDVVLSRTIADKVNARVGEDVIVHFFMNPPRFRRLKVTGIYETSLSEYYDSKFIIGDLRLIQRLYDWADSVAGGIQVYLRDPDSADEALIDIGQKMDYDLYIEKTVDTYDTIFEWLGLINRQVLILLAIILTVVCVNVISVVLILVMERTQMIGLLKALGAPNPLIRSIFVYNGINLIVKGLLFGNILGLGLCFLQYQFKLIPLNPHDYYMSYVPISWNWPIVIGLNILVFVVVTIVLLIPAAITARITPIKAMRFD